MQNTSRFFSNGRRGLGALGQDEDAYYNWGELVSEPPGSESVAIAAPTASMGDWFSSFLTPAIGAAKDIGVAYMGYQTQQDINALNLERARRGQAPLSASYVQAMQPQVGVNVGLSAQSKQLLLYGALGLGAMFAVSQFTKSRRS